MRDQFRPELLAGVATGGAFLYGGVWWGIAGVAVGGLLALAARYVSATSDAEDAPAFKERRLAPSDDDGTGDRI